MKSIVSKWSCIFVPSILLLGRQMKAASCIEEEGDPQLTLWFTLILRCAGDAFAMSAVILLDLLALDASRDSMTKLGCIRVWSCLGGSIGALASGLLLDYFKTNVEAIQWAPSAILFAGVYLLKSSSAISHRLCNLYNYGNDTMMPFYS